MALNASAVTITDGDEGVVQAIEENIFLNELEGLGHVKTGILRWGQIMINTMFEDDIDEQPYDVIIGADIVRWMISPPLHADA